MVVEGEVFKGWLEVCCARCEEVGEGVSFEGLVYQSGYSMSCGICMYWRRS